MAALHLLVTVAEAFGVHAPEAVFVWIKNWLQFAADSTDFALDLFIVAAAETFGCSDDAFEAS